MNIDADEIITELMIAPGTTHNIAKMKKRKAASAAWRALQARDPATITSRNILTHPGVLGTTVVFLVSGTQSEIDGVKFHMDHRGEYGDEYDWERNLCDAVNTAGIDDVDLEYVVVHLDTSVEQGFRLQHYPWEVAGTHDPSRPATFIGRQLNKGKHGTYFCTENRIYKGERRSVYRFSDKEDAAMAKIFFV